MRKAAIIVLVVCLASLGVGFSAVMLNSLMSDAYKGVIHIIVGLVLLAVLVYRYHRS